MPTVTRTFRVFVSSTFNDLKAERDALQRDMFPKLRKLCEENGACFQAIDLRWGVRDEAALDQQTMEICLREIERCQQTGIKPNFIVLLGERYGWRPVPARIEAKEFDRVCGRIADVTDRQLIDAWYERDDNAVPPEYLLKSRTGEFMDKDVWNTFEQRLHRILREAARDAELTPESLIKYEVSATHQEILKGLGETEGDRKHVFAFFRDSAADITEDPDITSLKKYLREKLAGGNIRSFPAADSAKLCADVEELLKPVILAEAGKFKSRPALDLEIEAHEAFAHDRAMHFIGRKAVLGAIDDHIRGGESRPLMVHGASGCGKSAIVAKASAQAKTQVPGAVPVLIRRFIGVTPDSSNGITLLHSLCEQLSREYGVIEETPAGFQPLVVAFHDRMARATAARPLVLFFDALDQLRSDDEARAFTWLRHNLPPHVSLVVSTTEIPAGIASAPRVWVEDFPVDEAREVLAARLQDAHRKLEPEQREKVLTGFSKSGLPLYLRLAFEEARRWRSFEAAEKCAVGDDVGSMIDVLFNRLTEESNHGPIIVNRSLGFLAVARYGLTEDEMLDVLAADDEVWRDFELRAHHTPPARQLPVIVWSRLFLDLEPYLNERAVPGGNVMAFYHRQVAERAASLYLQKDEGISRHAELAEYFGKQSHWQNKVAMLSNQRKITELVRHQVGANSLSEMETTLTDLDFVAAKCAAGLVVDLELDYRVAIAALPEALAEMKEEARLQSETAHWTREIIDYARQWSARHDRLARGETIVDPEPKLPEPVRSVELPSKEHIQEEADRIRRNPTRMDCVMAFGRFITGHHSALLNYGARPGFVLQQAFDSADSGPVAGAAERWQSSGVVWLKRSNRPPYSPRPPCLRVLQGASALSVTPDGRRAVSGGPRAMLGGEGNTLRVWDLETGTCLHVLEGHSSQVSSVSITPDGRRAVSGSYDNKLRVWDLESGTCLRTLEGHNDLVWSVSMTPDGRRAVSGSQDRTLRLWDLESGTCLRTLEGQSMFVMSVGITPDGRRAVCRGQEQDDTLRLWDLESGTCLRTLEGHSGEVWSVSVTPDGRRAVSGSHDNTLRVWDLETGTCLLVLRGHSSFVTSVSITPDGRRAASGEAAVSSGEDKTLRVWDLETGTCVRVLEGHSSHIQIVSLEAGGRRAVSVSFDNTVRIWDLEGGGSLRVPQEQSGSVDRYGPGTGVCITSDGRRGVSGSPDKIARVWDLETGTCLHMLKGHNGWVYCVCLTPDGRHVLTGSLDGTVRIWNLETGNCLRVLEGHGPRVMSVDVTPDGRRAVSAGADETLRVWDLESGTCLHRLAGHTGPVWSVSVTPDGRRAVSGGADKTLQVWDLESGRCLRMLKGHRWWVECVSLTPDGRHAVSASADTLLVWDVESGRCLRTLKGHSDRIRSVKVTPDGRHAVSGGWDNTVRVWDLATGACILVCVATAWIEALALALDGLVICAGLQTGEMAFYTLMGITSRGWASIPRPAITPHANDAAYEALLRRGLDLSRCEKGLVHEETLAHLEALAVHLERTGRTEEVRSVRKEQSETVSRVAEEEQDRSKRRQDAANRIFSGDYSGAETLLRGLLQERFEMPSTHCHLARVLLMMDRVEEARTEIDHAYAIREDGHYYVVPRILFFKCVFSMLDADDTATIVGQIKAALSAPDAHLEWTIQPLLDHLSSRLGETNYQFLKAVAEALSDANAMLRLDDFSEWRDATIPGSS
jgi:WD40 repeat protein